MEMVVSSSMITVAVPVLSNTVRYFSSDSSKAFSIFFRSINPLNMPFSFFNFIYTYDFIDESNMNHLAVSHSSTFPIDPFYFE